MIPIDPQGAVQRDLFVVVPEPAAPAAAAEEVSHLKELGGSTSLAVNWLRLCYRILKVELPVGLASEDQKARASELGESAKEPENAMEPVTRGEPCGPCHQDCRAAGLEMDSRSDCSVGNRSTATTLSTTVTLSSGARAPFRPLPAQDQRRGTLQLTELEEKQVRQLEKKIREMDKLAAREARGEKLDPLQVKKLQSRVELENAINNTVAMMKVRLGYCRRNQNSQ